jgi:hypothetical protein
MHTPTGTITPDVPGVDVKMPAPGAAGPITEVPEGAEGMAAQGTFGGGNDQGDKRPERDWTGKFAPGANGNGRTPVT